MWCTDVAELMLLGFISLLLTVFQNKVASICMPERFGHRMLPCPYVPPASEASVAARRRLFATEATATTGCKAVSVPSLFCYQVSIEWSQIQKDARELCGR